VARNPTPAKPSQPRAEAGDTPRSQRAAPAREGSQSHAEPSPDRLRQQLETNLQDAQQVMDYTQSYVMGRLQALSIRSIMIRQSRGGPGVYCTQARRGGGGDPDPEHHARADCQARDAEYSEASQVAGQYAQGAPPWYGLSVRRGSSLAARPGWAVEGEWLATCGAEDSGARGARGTPLRTEWEDVAHEFSSVYRKGIRRRTRDDLYAATPLSES
jgi:hypothetical protein